MSSKKSRTLRFTLSAECIGNENDTHSTIGTFIMPLGASDEPVYSVHLPGDRLGETTRLPPESHARPSTLRSKGTSERGSGGDAVEMLDGLHIDPMGDIRDARP